MITYPTNKLQKVLLGGGCEQRNLPSGYTQVEYLESSGTQYIDTTYIPPFMNSTKTVRITTVFETVAPLVAWKSVVTNLRGNDYVYAITPFGSGDNLTIKVLYGYQGDIINTGLKSGKIKIETISQATTFSILANDNLIGTGVCIVGPSESDIIKLLYKTTYRLYSFSIDVDGVMLENLIPAKRNSDSVLGMYDTVTGNFLTNVGTGTFTAGADVTPTPNAPMDIVCNNGAIRVDNQGQIYTNGTQEVVTDSLGDTASAEMLLAVGDYKDTQEVLSGVVSRSVGIKVLDGSEGWAKIGNTYGFGLPQHVYGYVIGAPVMCNQYRYSAIVSSNAQNVITNTSGGNALRILTDDTVIDVSSTQAEQIAQFKQFLADQYNAGTPVIVVYPLATPTTEQVTPQPLAGSSATVTAGSIDNLPIESSTIAELKKRYIGDKEVHRVYME